MKKIFIFSTLIFLSSYLLVFLSACLLTPVAVHGQEKAQAIDIGVTAQVPSPVSAANSTVALNATETLADPVNHPILLTVYLRDINKQPLADKEVIVSSDRGGVDVIEAITKLSQYQAHAAEPSALQKDKTDSDGKVSFRITSFMPGQTNLSVKADSVELEPQIIKFIPLPFPANVTISVRMPFSKRELVLYSPRLDEENLSSLQREAQKSANTNTKIEIAFWIFFLFFVIIFGTPVFIVLNFINLSKIRYMEKEQTLLLKKMFPPNYNRHG